MVSGDCVVVADDAAPYGSPAAERRVNLSSIRAPRIGNPKKEEKPAAYAREAKEYLRNLLIGQQVTNGSIDDDSDLCLLCICINVGGLLL